MKVQILFLFWTKYKFFFITNVISREKNRSLGEREVLPNLLDFYAHLSTAHISFIMEKMSFKIYFNLLVYHNKTFSLFIRINTDPKDPEPLQQIAWIQIYGFVWLWSRKGRLQFQEAELQNAFRSVFTIWKLMRLLGHTVPTTHKEPWIAKLFVNKFVA